MNKNLLQYWRSCLLDAERKNIPTKGKSVILNLSDDVPEYIGKTYTRQLFSTNKQINKKEEEEEPKLKIQIAPCVLLPEFENGQATGRDRPEYPFWIVATLLQDGTLKVCDNAADRIPIFIRSFLDPNAMNDKTIASLSNTDRALGEFDTNITDWKPYWKACEKLFRKVTGKSFREMNYSDDPEILILKATDRGMAQKIVNLYDKLLKDKTPHHLLEQLLQEHTELVLQQPDDKTVYCNTAHWAQMSGEFPLSVSQRETLAMYTSPDCSNIFAVNGPPGTGKTTFLQTVIANRLVHNVLNNPDDPEIIVASSANNQAITNILKDFRTEQPEKGAALTLSQRWLPELDTLGLYLSSKEDKENQYKMMKNPAGKGFPEEYDNPERVQEYRTYFLQRFNRFFSKQYKNEQECQHFLRKQMNIFRQEIQTHIKVACIRQYGKEKGNSLISKLFNKLQKVLPDYEALIENWEHTHDFKSRYDKLIANPEYCNLPYTADMAVRLDISYRYLMFWYAIHYREAEFIKRLSISEDEEQLSRLKYTERLKRISCIMPVFISTFHSLPKYLVCSESGNKDTPLYSGIDLLIVDESGQVSPELAIPSFSLAKQAILVGDVEQIEPVWSISDEYSFINLKRFGIVSDESDKRYAFLQENGFLSSSGSIMKMARKSCNFAAGAERGAFLTEHRRCVDPIISYCNDYIYHGRLIPKKGNELKYKKLPPKGYVHVNGFSEPGKTGSRLNKAEAAAIVAWLQEEKENLEGIYRKPIHQIVAIVTPFKAQEKEIRDLTENIQDRTENIRDRTAFTYMTIGTVHALQGAQCPIVIFSTVNSPNDPSCFMERDLKYNLINVAVSRAQHHFLVFGNMNIFHPELNTPVGNMAKWLFDDPQNEISGSFIYQQEKPLCLFDSFERLNTLKMHTDMLQQAFREARQRILIVSPFISIRAIEQDQIVSLIRQAVNRKVEIIVYTDSRLDYDFKTNRLRSEAEAGRKALQESGARLVLLKGIHNKSLAVDNQLLVEGSFNWLAASRSYNNSRHECSLLLNGTEVTKHISDLMDELNKIKSENGAYNIKQLPPESFFTEEATCPGFFSNEKFDTCSETDIRSFREQVEALGIRKRTEDLPEYVQKQRKQFPRAFEPWLKEEKVIIQNMMLKTNNIGIFMDCLQRTCNAIQIQIEGKQES